MLQLFGISVTEVKVRKHRPLMCAIDDIRCERSTFTMKET